MLNVDVHSNKIDHDFGDIGGSQPGNIGHIFTDPIEIGSDPNFIVHLRGGAIHGNANPFNTGSQNFF